MNKKHTRTLRSPFSMGSERLEERRVMDASAPNFDLSGVEAETAYVGDQYSLDLMSAGGSLTEGDFTFTLDPDPDQTPAGATMSPDGVLNWTPSLDQVGSHTLRVVAMNSESPMKGDFESITIEVQVGSPVVDLNGEDADGGDFQTTFQFGQGPVAVADSDMVVADPNDETLMSATVTITNLADGEAELLTVDTEGTEITAEYAGGVLQLSGEASVEQYQQVLRSVRYSNSDPAVDVTPRVIEFTVSDGVTNSEVATSTININLPPDLAPIADQELDAGAELMLEISATDPNEADQLSFMIDPESPNFVSLIQEVGARTAQLMLTPGIDVTPGIFSVSILVFDNAGLADVESFFVEVAANEAPVSLDDAYQTNEDAAFSVSAPGVLENDTDADGDAIAVTGVNGDPANVGEQITLDSGALLTLNANGSFDYDPNGMFAALLDGETAEDTFSYTIADSTGQESAANVVMTIAGVNTVPVSVDDAFETTEDVALSISAPGVLENDADSDGDVLTVSEVNGEAANVGAAITLDSGALLTLNADGSFDYDPNGAFAALAEGETAEDSFAYTATDDSGFTSTSNVVITINGVDHAPESVNDAYETSEDTALNISASGVLENDADADGDSLTVLEVNGEPADVGAAITLESSALLTLNADGSFDYDPNGAFASLAEGESAEESFAYTATDSTGLTSTATVFITVNGVDHAPEAAEDAYETAENVTLSVAAPGVLANDVDLDGDTLLVTEVDGDALNVGMPITLDSGALLTLNADGSFDYDPNGVYASLAAGETAEDQVAYTVADSTGLTSSSLLRFTITGVDNEPVAAGDSYETAEDVTLNIPAPGVLANDADADGDALSVSEMNGEPADVGMPITLDSGALLTLNADGSFDYDPNGAFNDLSAGETAEDSFSYTAADGSGLTSAATVAITINGVTNLIVEGDEYVTDEDSPLSMAAPGVLANDTGAATVVMVNGEEANVGEQITLDSGALLTVNADGSFDYDPNGSFETLRAGESTLDTFSYVADDGSGTTDAGTVSIVINGLNDAPIAEDDAFSTDEATALSIVPAGVLLNDSDTEGTTLAIVAVNGNPADVGTPIGLDSGALLTLNADGSFDYDPNGVFDDMATGDTAADSFSYTVSDGDGGEDTATVMLTINGLDTDNGTNRPPLNQVPGTQTIAAGLSLEFGSANSNAISVSDPDADGAFVQVTISVQHGILQLASLNAQRIMLVGSFEQISSMMEGLVYTPEDGFTGTDTFTINSNDRGATGTGNPRADIDTFDIVVTPSEAIEEVFADSEMVIDLFFS
ncbi:Ig-like domain-containing protein [Blastopirellula retiformator]|nr:Ig-like domain-containing protein [Blastopirellula retiformator]